MHTHFYSYFHSNILSSRRSIPTDWALAWSCFDTKLSSCIEPPKISAQSWQGSREDRPLILVYRMPRAPPKKNYQQNICLTCIAQQAKTTPLLRCPVRCVVFDVLVRCQEPGRYLSSLWGFCQWLRRLDLRAPTGEYPTPFILPGFCLFHFSSHSGGAVHGFRAPHRRGGTRDSD